MPVTAMSRLSVASRRRFDDHTLPMLLQAIAISRLTVQLVQIMRARLDLA